MHTRSGILLSTETFVGRFQFDIFLRGALRFMKKALISVISALLFASCSFLSQPVGEYFSYWGSEVFVTTSIVKVPNQNDSEGIISVASDKNAEVILNIANPKNFNLVMPSADNTEMIHFNAFDPQPVFGVDYMIEKLSAKELKLTYTAQFLKKHEWGQKDLGATLTMFADDGREFKKNYTFKIKSNTKPPQPSVILAQTNESTPHYVLCLTVPDMDTQVNGKKLHKDIAQIVINESSYELKINDSGLDFVKPTDESFITRTDVAQLTTHGAEAVPTGNWTLFYKTDRQVGGAYKEYTVTLKDQRGLSSEKLETGTTINKPAEETVLLNTGTQESGSGTNALPFIIQAAGTKPEAQLIISCTSSGTTVHCTVTDVNTGISSEYNGNPANVPLGLNGENEKLYEVKYNTKGYGYNPTTLKTKYYKILKLHTVTFNANGGKFADDSTAKTESVLHGRTVTAPSASPTRVGNVFVGWYKEEDGTTEWNFTDDTIRSNTIIYAKWSDKAVEIKSDEDGAWKKLKEEAAKTSGVSVIVIEGEIKATTDSGNSGEITIGRNLTIQGKTGAATDKLNANGQNHRIFKVTVGKTLTLKNLTLTKGKPDISDEGSNGGAIFAKGGTLNMTNCEVKGNKADNGGGGGIYATDDGSTVSSVTISDSTIGGTGADKNESGSNDSGGGICIGYGCSLTMKNTKVIGNESDLSGGGIFADTKSTLSMEHCTVSGNSAYSSGGGIHAIGKLTMTGCIITDNETTGDSGGGVYVSGTAEIKGASTIVHNKAYVSGGGIYMASGSVTLINATIGGDQYYDDTDLGKTKGNKAKDGGGIYVASGTLSIKDSTLSFNKSTSGSTGGGGGINANNGTFTIKGCTLKNNDSGSGTGGGIKADNITLTMTGCTLTDNNAGGGGGGILTSGTSSLTMETCTLSNNVANLNGGGGVYASGNAFTMTDCTLTDNVTNYNGGGGVYVADGTFTMKGSSRITPSSGADENAIGKNEVFLKNGKMITVPAELTGTLPVARITPATYASTTQVLTGGAVGSEHAKFTVTTESGTPPQEWIIKNDGHLQKAPITVSSTDSLAWKKLKDAVAAANDGDVFSIDGEIKATAGGNSGEIEVKKNITIQGKKTDRTDTLNANKDDFGTVPFRIFKVEPGKKLTLENLTLKNGKNNETASGGSSTPKGKGGAIYSKGELEIRNVLITDCEAKYSGGGIYCSMSSSIADDERKLVIKDTEVTSCKAPEPTYGTGGGVYIVGENCRMNVKLSDVKIKNNEASSSAAGLCLYGSHGATTTADSVVLTRVTLHENKLTDTGARGGAGMVFATYDRDSAITLKNCTVTKNESKTFGGGISLHSSSSGLVCGKLILEVSTVSENKAQNGGGIYVNESNLVMKNTVLTSNTATMEGGGVYVEAGTFTMKDSSRITPSSGADGNAIGKNEVFLKNGKMITVDGALTGTHPVARITPAAYNTTTQVLTGGAVDTEHSKFTVTPKDLGSGNTQQWEINSTGFLQKTPVVIDSSGDAWKKLKDAVAAANDDDVIIIDGAIKATNSSGGKIEIKKNLTIRGKNGADSDILNANRGALNTNAHSIFVMDSGKTLKLENLTLKGGKGIEGGTLGGGAILIPSGGGTIAELSDCVIEDCQAEKGGAIGCGKGSTVTLTNTTIKKCKASGSGSDSGGGAIFAQGATVEMTGCTLTGNEAKSGGAIYAVKKDSTASTVTISGGTIGGTGEGEANKATGNDTGSDGGGGIYVGETCTLTMKAPAGSPAQGVQVIGNTAVYNGAGIYTKGNLTMESCTITDNKTTGANNNTGGGGVYVESGSVEIKDATKIYHNYTDASGGGIYVNDGTVTLKDATIGGEQLYDGTDSGKTKGNKAQGCGGIYVNAGTITMENCTLSSNTALYAGGIQADNGNLTVKGCTLTNNKAGYGGGIYVKGGTFTMENCTLTGNQGDGGVYVEGGTFKMKGSSRITPSTGGDANVAGKNDVYLKDGAKITVDSVLTGTAPVARITVPDNKYLTSTQVLTAGAGVTLANETYKFAVTPQTSTAQPWTVGGNGYLKEGRYTEVPYNQLEAYLANNASATEVNYIEVTGSIPAAHFKGTAGSSTSPTYPGALGQLLKNNASKKVALKLPNSISGLTDMSNCFASCKNLISVENIPSDVTDMRCCFYGCENLTTVPAIPATVRGMMECFRFCTSLTTAPNIPSGVNSMAYCFDGCTSLTTVSNIPSSVTDMEGCFQSCTSLTTVPDIPSSVTDMRYCFRNCTVLKRVKINRGYADYKFDNTFEHCTALKDGGIKVPSVYLAIYKANAGTMGTTKEKFSAF